MSKQHKKSPYRSVVKVPPVAKYENGSIVYNYNSNTSTPTPKSKLSSKKISPEKHNKTAGEKDEAAQKETSEENSKRDTLLSPVSLVINDYDDFLNGSPRRASTLSVTGGSDASLNKADITPVEKVEILECQENEKENKSSSADGDWSNTIKIQPSPPPPYNKTTAAAMGDTKTDDKHKITPEWKSLFLDFTQHTTIHGVRFTTTQTRFLSRRWLWVLVTCGAFAVFLYYLIERVSFYFEYQTNVNVGVNYVDQVEFPAVTLCNQNQFKLTSSANGGYFPQVDRMSQSLTTTGILSCPDREFKCDVKCIPLSRVCDGIADCKDQTDEHPTKCGCIRIKVTGSSEFPAVNNSLINKIFEYDRSQNMSNRGLYYTYANNSRHMVYLFYNEATQQWVFSETLSPNSYDMLLFTSDSVLAKTSMTPDKYSGDWMVNGTVHNLRFLCTSPNAESQSMDSLAKTKLDKVNLKYMYDNGSHNVNDMIQSCSWKGRPCTAQDFDVIDTDLGRCYRYTPPDAAEQAGPGFGLAITVNIQEYEYTKNKQDGVGVQLLLHNPKDLPLMTETSFAISPGLYTMVSVERTEVKNLRHPWGKCKSIDLDYYDDYSVATCNLNCLNKLVRSKCECKDVYMPQIRDNSTDYDYCSVEKYIQCWKPKLDEFRRYGNFCSCATPCIEILYVPSLSFASITSDKDLLSGEELQKMIKMQSNLIEAREITYRIQVDKYMETMRMFKTTIRQAIQTDTKLLKTTEAIRNELAEIKTVTSEVNSDCLWFMEEQYKFIQLLRVDVYSAVSDIYTSVREKLYFQLEQLHYRLERIYSCWDMGTCGYNYCMNNNCGGSCCCGSVCFHAHASTWRYLLNPWYLKTKDIIQAVKNEIKVNLDNVISSALDSVTFPYRLSLERLNPLLPYLRTNCTWCMNDTHALALVLKSSLKESLLNIVIPNIETVESVLDSIHGSSFDNGNFLLSSSNRTALLENAKRLSASANNTLRLIDQYLKQPVKDAIDITEDLLRLITPKCGSELQKLYDEYSDQHDRMDSDIELLETVLAQHAAKLSSYQKRYRAYTLSLTHLHQTSGSTDLITYIQGVNVTTDSTFKGRAKATERLQNQMGIIYYWICAQVPDSEMSAKSMIWKRFGVSSPSFSVKKSENTNGVPVDEHYYLNDTDITRFWHKILIQLNGARINMGIGILDMLAQLDNIHSYLSTFVAGNEISGSFYQKNYLQLDIFYKELTERNIKQQKAYELPALLGEVGGLMGLLLGASVLTILEFIDLLMYNGINKCIERKEKSKTKQNSSHL